MNAQQWEVSTPSAVTVGVVGVLVVVVVVLVVLVVVRRQQPWTMTMET